MTERPKISSKQIAEAAFSDVIPTKPELLRMAKSLERLIETASKMESDPRFKLALGRALKATFRQPYADFPPEAVARLVLDGLKDHPDEEEFLADNVAAAVLGALIALSQSDWNTSDAGPLRLQVKGWEEMCSQPAPSWLIEGILPDAGVAMLWGPSGSYKSFVALDLAAHVCLGLDWNGHKITPALRGMEQPHESPKHRVLYVAAEGNMSARADCWTAHNHDAYVTHAGFGDAAGGDAFRFLDNYPINLLDPDSVNALAEYVSHEQYSLIVIDTLARTIPGADENAAQDMSKAMDALARLGTAAGAVVLVIHHTGKDESRAERGSSAIRAAVDASIKVHRPGDYRVNITLQKQRDGDDEGIIRMRLQQVTSYAGHPDREKRSLVAVPDTGPPVPFEDATLEAKARSEARRILEEKGELPSINELKEATGVSRRTAEKALKPLRPGTS
jgi:hypothetical protein